MDIFVLASPPQVAANEIVESDLWSDLPTKPQRKLTKIVHKQPSKQCMYVVNSNADEKMIVKLKIPQDVEEHQAVDQDQVMKDALENLKREHDYTPVPLVMPHEEIFCETCGKTCKSESALIRHMQFHGTVAPSDEKLGTWKCEFCEKVYKSKSALYQHRKSHSGERPHQCTYCPKAFLHREKLKNHIRTHTGERPYQCSMCPKRLSCKLSLECHERTHTGERPFECSVCSKTFARKDYLEIHIRTHTGEKPYQCKECPIAFSSPVALHRHKLVHTGEKPYACPICFKAFTQSNSVKLHVRTVHEGQKAPYGRRARREKLRLAKAKAPSPPPPSSDDSIYYDDDDLE